MDTEMYYCHFCRKHKRIQTLGVPSPSGQKMCTACNAKAEARIKHPSRAVNNNKVATVRIRTDLDKYIKGLNLK